MHYSFYSLIFSLLLLSCSSPSSNKTQPEIINMSPVGLSIIHQDGDLLAASKLATNYCSSLGGCAQHYQTNLTGDRIGKSISFFNCIFKDKENKNLTQNLNPQIIPSPYVIPSAPLSQPGMAPIISPIHKK